MCRSMFFSSCTSALLYRSDVCEYPRNWVSLDLATCRGQLLIMSAGYHKMLPRCNELGQVLMQRYCNALETNNHATRRFIPQLLSAVHFQIGSILMGEAYGFVEATHLTWHPSRTM